MMAAEEEVQGSGVLLMLRDRRQQEIAARSNEGGHSIPAQNRRRESGSCSTEEAGVRRERTVPAPQTQGMERMRRRREDEKEK